MIMQIEIVTYAAAAAVLTGWLGIVAYTGLKGWNGWLALKHAEAELAARHAHAGDPATLTAATRIDMADIKERIRKLEAIASGVDL